MVVKVASRDPPMTLARRQELQQTCVPFSVPPHKIVFSPSLDEIWNKQQLVAFVDGLLLKLIHEHPAVNSPTPNAWKLIRNGTEEDLTRWNPSSLDTKSPVFIISTIKDHLPLVTTPLLALSETWTWAKAMKSFNLPLGDAFLLQSNTHIAIALRCQTKVKISNKKRKVHESLHDVLIPVRYTISNVRGLINSSQINGIYHDPHEDNLLSDNRAISELGWTSGTVLRLELW